MIAYPGTRNGSSNARSVLEQELNRGQIEIPMLYPITTEGSNHAGGYEAEISDFYEEMAVEIAKHLELGRDVAVLCEGDPFF